MQYRLGVAGCLFALSLILSGPVAAEDSSQTERVVPEIRALRINSRPPVIDGNLEDSIWSKPDIELGRASPSAILMKERRRLNQPSSR